MSRLRPGVVALVAAIALVSAACGRERAVETGPGSQVRDMATEASGWAETVGGWRRDLAAIRGWRARVGARDSLMSADVDLHIGRSDDQQRRIDDFARQLADHRHRLDAELRLGVHAPVGLEAAATAEHAQLKTEFDMLSAAQLSLDDEHAELAERLAGRGP